MSALALGIRLAADRDGGRFVFEERRAVASFTIGLAAQFARIVGFHLIDHLGNISCQGTGGRGLAIDSILTGNHSTLRGESCEGGREGQESSSVQMHVVLSVSASLGRY